MIGPGLPPSEVLNGRPDFAGDLGEAAAYIGGRRVLLTGAAGSIGTSLARVVLAAEPASLVLLDHHEHSLFSLERNLGGTRAGLRFELADVRDPARLEEILDEAPPDIVFHLAAAKHVPYGERFPESAVATNVLATQQLLRLCDQAGVETFLYPSSDKSVQPPSVYGATKRIAEGLVQAAAGQRRWSIVRYVNIIGTRGSVIETFAQQLQADRPLGVTDDRMTRYWMSMEEALWSALLSAHCATRGEVVMPACGEPVPIIETARRLAGWYRPDRVPYPISCTGIRPGERLHEVLLSPNESFAESSLRGLRSVRTSREPDRLQHVSAVVGNLRLLVDRGDRAALATACLEAADALQ